MAKVVAECKIFGKIYLIAGINIIATSINDKISSTDIIVMVIVNTVYDTHDRRYIYRLFMFDFIPSCQKKLQAEVRSLEVLKKVLYPSQVKLALSPILNFPTNPSTEAFR